MLFKVGSFVFHLGQMIMLVPIVLALWNGIAFSEGIYPLAIPFNYYVFTVLVGGGVCFAGTTLKLMSGAKLFRDK